MAESKEAILTAIGANLAIAMAKFAGAALTGSASMLAEGIHSVVDTANQLLLLVGLKRAARPADAKHPFGYGREIYFFSFVVALLIFSIGGIASIYEGIEKIRQPQPETDVLVLGAHIPALVVNFAILGFATLAEGYSLFIALRSMPKNKHSPLTAIRRSKDPSLFVVIAEDTAALVGLVLAMLGVGLSSVLAMPLLDGIASIAIGLVLVAVAIFLMIETHGLLVGEAAAPPVVAAIDRLARLEPAVLHVNEVLTQHLGPDDILVNISLDLDDTLTAAGVEALVSRLEAALKAEIDGATRIFIEIQATTHRHAN